MAVIPDDDLVALHARDTVAGSRVAARIAPPIRIVLRLRRWSITTPLRVYRPPSAVQHVVTR